MHGPMKTLERIILRRLNSADKADFRHGINEQVNDDTRLTAIFQDNR